MTPKSLSLTASFVLLATCGTGDEPQQMAANEADLAADAALADEAAADEAADMEAYGGNAAAITTQNGQ